MCPQKGDGVDAGRDLISRLTRTMSGPSALNVLLLACNVIIWLYACTRH